MHVMLNGYEGYKSVITFKGMKIEIIILTKCIRFSALDSVLKAIN